MKKIISLLICTVVLFSSIIEIAPATYAAVDGADIPVIHISGYGAQLVRNNEEGKKETIYPLQIPTGYVEEKVQEFLPVFAKAFFTQQWGEFCDTLVDILVPLFEPIALDKNGEASDGSRADWTWSRNALRDYKNADGKYSATAYKFYYDWRLDPYVTADRLRLYIEDVMYVTGAEKVALFGRCLGSNIVAAYMQKYDGEYVQEVVHYASSVYGATVCSKAFTGDLYLHSEGLSRFVYEYDLGLGELYDELIQSFVTLLNKTYGLDIACWAVNNVLEDIYLDIFPRVLIASYGTFPSYWSMVSIDDFDRAMETVFYGSDLNEYSGLIDKIHNYRNNVQLKFEENSMAQAERGIEFSNIVKYGLQSTPVTRNANELSDQIVTVRESSFGATAALVGETLSDEYLDTSLSEYISPDKQIDASTCFSPDTTWFIKNLEHNYFPDCVNALVSEIINNVNYTIKSSEEYPQYLVYDTAAETISPMTAENMNIPQKWNVSFFEALMRFMKRIFELIKQSFA